MTTLRVCWTGIEPICGEWLVLANPKRVFFVSRVERLHTSPSSPRPRLLLHGARRAAAQVPPGSMVHPWSRTTAPDPGTPAAVRLRQDGPTAVMRAVVREGGRASDWRAFCPLRRMREKRGSGVTERHIMAADLLRHYADLAVIGAGGVLDLSAIRACGVSPRFGPTAAALEQAGAGRMVGHMLAPFGGENLELLTAVVLRNFTIYSWVAALSKSGGGPYHPQREMGRLLALLDLLADRLAGEIAVIRQAGERAVA